MISQVSFEESSRTFAIKFVKEEYKLWTLAYTEKNSDLFWKQREKFVSDYFTNGIETDVRRKMKPDEAWFEEAKDYIKAIQKRVVFQIKIYKDKKYKFLSAIYLSSRHVGGESYFELLIVALIDNHMKIISSCLTDNEGYFDYHDGAEFDELPESIKVIKFQPPRDPADLEEYLSE